MGVYGDPISDAIPSVGTLGTGYATSVNALLTEMKARLSSKVDFTSLNPANATLDMNAQALQNAAYLGMYEQSASPSGTPFGRLVYYGGNLWFVGTAGAVQITNGTTVNVSTSGGFVGDYGSSGRLASYEDAAETYHFYDDQSLSQYAKLKGRGFDFTDDTTGRMIRVKPRTTIAATYDLDLPAAPPAAGVSVLTINSSGQMARGEDAAVTNVFTAEVKHGDVTITYPAVGLELVNVSNFSNAPGTLGAVTATAATGRARLLLPMPPVGRRLKTVTVGISNVAGSTCTVTCYRSTGVAETALGNNNTVTVGTTTVAVTATHTVAANQFLTVDVNFTGGAAGNVAILSVAVTYDYV